MIYAVAVVFFFFFFLHTVGSIEGRSGFFPGEKNKTMDEWYDSMSVCFVRYRLSFDEKGNLFLLFAVVVYSICRPQD